MRQDRYARKNEGYVYILANKYIPYLVKIGKTEDIDRRLEEINNHEGVPGKFCCIFCEKVFNMHIVEREIHWQLKAKLEHDGYQVVKTKEFFVVPSDGYAIQTTKEIIATCKKNYTIQKEKNEHLSLFDDKTDEPKGYWYKKSGICVVKWDSKFKPRLKKKSPIGAAAQYYVDDVSLFDDWKKKRKKKKMRKKK